MPVFIANEPTSDRGGIQRFAACLAREYGKNERVVIIEPGARGARTRDGNVEYRRYAPGSRLKEFVSAILTFGSVAIGNRSDFAVAGVWFPSALAALVIPRRFRGPVAAIANGTEIAPGRGGLRKALMRWTFHHADGVFAVSSFTRDLLVRAGVTVPIVVVNCGVDVSAVPRARAQRPTILSVGRLVDRKGFDRLIASLPEVKRQIPDVSCEIVGNGPQRAYLETLAGQLGVRDVVTFHGAVDDAQLARAYARAWCFALPCRRIGDDVEGFGIVYLEAAIHGLATIGGRASGAEDAIVDGETGFLVDGNEPSEIAAAATRLLRDPEESERMGARGRQRAETQFTWRGVADKIAAAMAAARKP